MSWTVPKVLFVDDDADLLESLADVWGLRFRVVTALGGAAGLAALAEHQPQIVVSDMRMPGMDGATFLARVRKRAPQTVRLLLTGHADLDAAMRAVNEGGVHRFLTKPCPPDVMGPALEDAFLHFQAQARDRARLGARVDELTGQLAHAERLATLGTMSASLGHEMNNSLALLECAVEEIRAEAERGRAPDAEVLETLVQGKERLKAQAQGTLSLARPAPREVRPIDLGQTMRQVVGVLTTVGVARRARLTLETDAEPAWVMADRTELEQIAINLVKNAVDALTERPGASRVQLAVRADETRVRLVVADDAAGIPADRLARIFEPFFTTKAPGAGTGLGLPLVKRLTEAHGGVVTVHSVVGQGTTVTVDLPRWDASSARARRSSTIPAPAGP